MKPLIFHTMSLRVVVQLGKHIRVSRDFFIVNNNDDYCDFDRFDPNKNFNDSGVFLFTRFWHFRLGINGNWVTVVINKCLSTK